MFICDDFLGTFDGKRPQQHGVDETEDRGVSPDAQSERQHGH
jgi:hypothetical protein